MKGTKIPSELSRVKGVACRVSSFGLRVQCQDRCPVVGGLVVQDSGFRVQGAGFGV